MANPYGIEQVNVPGLLAMHQQLKQQRLADLYQARQVAIQDKQLERQDKEDARKDAMDATYAKIFAPATPTAGGAPSATPGTEPATPAGGAPVSAAPASESEAPQINPEGLRALMATGPEGVAAAQSIMKMNAEQIKAAQEGLTRLLDIKARVIGGVRALPPEQRESEYQRQRGVLIANGAKPDSLPLHWSEEQADAMVEAGLSAAEALGMKDKARQFAETVRHNRATEVNAAGNLDVARGRLGVSQGALKVAQDRAAHSGGADDSSDVNALLSAAGL